MNKRLLFAACFLTVTELNAQPWLSNFNTDKIKVQDVVDAYEASKSEAAAAKREKGLPITEDKDYHFYRWKWHAEAHTDENGYLVSPVKNYEEWLKRNNSHYKTTATNSSNWTFQGPTSSTGGYAGVGRINSIAFHPSDANGMWVATAGGGAWRTTNGGVSWTSMSHMLPVLGVSDIDIHPTSPNTIYMCTGDKNGSDTYSLGVMKSTNGGTTWDTTGLKWTVTQSRLINTLVINKANPNTLLVATSNGIYRSTNAGVSFVQEKTGNYKEIVYHPTDSNILYATGSALVSRSADGGNTWTDITGFTGKGRIAVAVTPANVSIVKLVVSNTSNGLDGIYNSTDTGKTFTRIYQATGSGCTGNILVGNMNGNGCGGQGWYDLCITINPGNANEVYVGGVNTWRSTNGGTSWSLVTQWWAQLPAVATVHADKHFMAFHPLIPGRLVQANDGGIYRSDNPSSTLWTDMTNGLGITQFYRNAVSHSSNFVLAGAQDNGTKSLTFTTWSDENGGDGMDCQVDYADSTIYYTSTQYGNIDRHAPSPLGDDQISDNIVGKPSQGAWITPFIINPHNHAQLIAGYKHLYATTDYGATWNTITTAHLDSSQNIHRIAMTPADNKTVYAITGFGSGDTATVYYTYNYNPASAVAFNKIVSPYVSRPSDIKVDHKKKDHFWLTFNNYNSPQVAEYNAGTWTTIKTGLPDVPVQCIEIDTSSGFMYVGTDIGVYYMDTSTKRWEAFNNGNAMPSIEVTDLGINYKRKELWASTYGRGLWKSALQVYPTPPDTTDTSTIVHVIPYTNKLFNIFPNPNNGVFTVKTTSAELFDKVLTLRIIDNSGRTVWQNKLKVNDAGMMYISTFGLPKGIYTLDAADDKHTIGRTRFQLE